MPNYRAIFPAFGVGVSAISRLFARPREHQQKPIFGLRRNNATSKKKEHNRWSRILPGFGRMGIMPSSNAPQFAVSQEVQVTVQRTSSPSAPIADALPISPSEETNAYNDQPSSVNYTDNVRQVSAVCSPDNDGASLPVSYLETSHDGTLEFDHLRQPYGSNLDCSSTDGINLNPLSVSTVVMHNSSNLSVDQESSSVGNYLGLHFAHETHEDDERSPSDNAFNLSSLSVTSIVTTPNSSSLSGLEEPVSLGNNLGLYLSNETYNDDEQPSSNDGNNLSPLSVDTMTLPSRSSLTVQQEPNLRGGGSESYLSNDSYDYQSSSTHVINDVWHISATAIASWEPSNLIIDRDERSLSMSISDSLDRNLIQARYRDMDTTLHALCDSYMLQRLSGLRLILPESLIPHPIDRGGNDGMIMTPSLEEFEWHGDIRGIPNPWRKLSQFDFNALRRLIMKDCFISVQDCLYLLDSAPELQYFEIGSIADVESAIEFQPLKTVLGCNKLETLHISTYTDLALVWEALRRSCETLKMINILIRNESANFTVLDVPSELHTLQRINIMTSLPDDIKEGLVDMVHTFNKIVTVQGHRLHSHLAC
ncbi:hypothetical protein BDQ17DRAFT_1352966 [Cyathus striatus]|nr:hypothetical protein BDQ17DRAFT_1352966 [Cyathus striatus]